MCSRPSISSRGRLPTSGPRALSTLALGLFLAACGDSAEAPQVTSLDPGDRFDEVAPTRVTDLSARPLNHRAVELSWTEVDDGEGRPAQYQVRMVTGGDWNSGIVVRDGACGYPIEGANIGSSVRCVVTGLESRTFYSFMVGSERAEVSGTVQGDPSSVAPATTTDEPFFKDPASAEIVSGSNLDGTVGQAVQTEIRVLLRDSAGQPLPDAYIVWGPEDGAGSTTSPVSISDDYGIARTVWTLGPGAGSQTLRAQAVGQPVLAVTADAAPGPVERLEFLDDTLRLAVGDEEPLAVQGWDAYGNPVEEIPLEWETSNREVAEVDPNGVGRVRGTGWTLVRGSVKDKWRKRKTRDSVTVIVKGPPQSVDDLALDAVGEDWMTIRFTEVDDGGGEAASYETRLGRAGASWDSASEITAGGCASPLTGTAIGAERACTVPGLDAGTDYRVFLRPFRGGNAKGKGKREYAESVASIAGTTLEPVQSPSGLTTESGAHQTGVVGDPLPAPVVVKVHDAQGAPVPGVDVVFTPSDGGTVSASTVTTDDNGRAQVAWTLGSRAGTQTLQSALVGAGTTSGASNSSLPPTVVPATASAGTPVSVRVQPAALSLDAGGTGSVSAQGLDEFGNVTSLVGLSWSSDDPGIASIDEAGRITAVGGGEVLVRATLGEAAGTARITVAAPEEPSVPDPARIDDLRVVGVTERSVELEFTEVDDGSGSPAWTEIRFALSPMGSGWPSATVLSSGTCASPIAGIAVGNSVRCVVDGLSESTAYDFQMVAWRAEEGNTVYSELSNVITATTDAGSAPSLPAVTSVVVSPAQVSFDQVGQTHQLTAIAYDASNNPVSTPIEWTTSDAGVATVSSSGLVTARGAGTVLITATALCCGEVDSSQVTVNIASPPPPPPPPASGVWVEQTWNFPDRAAMLADPNLSAGGNGTGLGDSRPITLPQAGPWGGTKVLENYYGVIPATSQPQVGTHWYLPDGAREIWIETWIRFGDDWQIGPDNPNYPGNVDHKTIFIWEGDGSGPWAQRWEVKFGPNWKSCVASAASHDISYHHFFDPPLIVQTWDTRHQRRQQDPTSECDARRDVWDGQWHNFRLHLKMGAGDGQMEVWWDGVKMIDMGGNLNTRSGSRWFDAITFGGNRNQGTNQPMSFFYGPARIYNTNPGW